LAFASSSLSLSRVLCAGSAASTAHRIHEDFSESLAGFGCHRVRATLLRLLIPQLPGTDNHSWPFFIFFVVVISSLFLPSSSSSSPLQRLLFPPGFCKEIVITSFFYYAFLNSFAGITDSSAISFSALWERFMQENVLRFCLQLQFVT
jgi:hypothetical protein